MQCTGAPAATLCSDLLASARCLLLPTIIVVVVVASLIILATIVDVIVLVNDTSALSVAQPRILDRTFAACFHVSSVGDIGRLCFERQRTFGGQIAWCPYVGLSFLARPRFIVVQLFEWLRIGDPLKSLGCCQKPYVWPEETE